MKIRPILLILLSCCYCGGPTDHKEPPILFDIWYGENQEFGTPGLPQKWINLLGNVSSRNGVTRMTYQLNDRTPVELTLGSDLHRLAMHGDFNIDIALDQLREGTNHLLLEALDSAGHHETKQIQLKITQGKNWPLPYRIKWSEVADLQQVVQVVDGHWEITDDGIRNLDMYYDRVLAFGDNNWQNYEVTTTIVFHDFTPPVKGPPTYNVSHAAIASRWPGHDVDSLQPNRKWYPLGATAEFRLTKDLDSCRWRVFDGPKPGFERFYIEQSIEDYRHIVMEKKYGMKHRVETLVPGKTRYSVKLWPFDLKEPESWDVVAVENDENLESGSALLIAHNTSVTFGDVYVSKIDN